MNNNQCVVDTDVLVSEFFKFLQGQQMALVKQGLVDETAPVELSSNGDNLFWGDWTKQTCPDTVMPNTILWPTVIPSTMPAPSTTTVTGFPNIIQPLRQKSVSDVTPFMTPSEPYQEALNVLRRGGFHEGPEPVPRNMLATQREFIWTHDNGHLVRATYLDMRPINGTDEFINMNIAIRDEGVSVTLSDIKPEMIISDVTKIITALILASEAMLVGLNA